MGDFAVANKDEEEQLFFPTQETFVNASKIGRVIGDTAWTHPLKTPRASTACRRQQSTSFQWRRPDYTKPGTNTSVSLLTNNHTTMTSSDNDSGLSEAPSTLTTPFSNAARTAVLSKPSHRTQKASVTTKREQASMIEGQLAL